MDANCAPRFRWVFRNPVTATSTGDKALREYVRCARCSRWNQVCGSVRASSRVKGRNRKMTYVREQRSPGISILHINGPLRVPLGPDLELAVHAILRGGVRRLELNLAAVSDSGRRRRGRSRLPGDNLAADAHCALRIVSTPCARSRTSLQSGPLRSPDQGRPMVVAASRLTAAEHGDAPCFYGVVEQMPSVRRLVGVSS